MVFVSYFLVSEQISFFLEYFYFLPFFFTTVLHLFVKSNIYTLKWLLFLIILFEIIIIHYLTCIFNVLPLLL